MKTLKQLLLTLIMAYSFESLAQVQCQLITPPNINVTYEKASSFSIYSARNIEVKAVLSFSGINSKSVALIINKLQLTSGTHIYNLHLLTNTIRYIDRNFEQYYQSMSEFMPGTYQLCLDLYCTTPPECIGSISVIEEQSNFCFELESTSPTPLLLAKPDDKEKLHTNLPFFQWIPPMPIASKIPLEYKMKIVELKLDQGPEDGMYRNRPIFESEMLFSTNHQYLSVYYPLEKGKKYAWMIDAYVSGKFLTNSEVWEFEIVPDLIINEAYMLKTNSDNGTLSWNKSKIKLGFETILLN